jgi:hypothetical protein
MKQQMSLQRDCTEVTLQNACVIELALQILKSTASLQSAQRSMAVSNRPIGITTTTGLQASNTAYRETSNWPSKYSICTITGSQLQFSRQSLSACCHSQIVQLLITAYHATANQSPGHVETWGAPDVQDLGKKNMGSLR